MVKFRPFLEGNSFILETDHKPIEYISKTLNSKSANKKVFGWFSVLRHYNFVVRHIKGKDNIGSDWLSRLQYALKKAIDENPSISVNNAPKEYVSVSNVIPIIKDNSDSPETVDKGEVILENNTIEQNKEHAKYEQFKPHIDDAFSVDVFEEIARAFISKEEIPKECRGEIFKDIFNQMKKNIKKLA